MSDVSERILVFAPRGRDAELMAAALTKADLEVATCACASELIGRVREGAGCAIITSDVLGRELQRELRGWLAEQPPWSDFPIVVLTSGPSRDVAFDLGNVTILERPVAPHTLLATVRSTLRGRRRQYEARAAIQQRDQFLAMLGHELRNPLAAIVLASEPLPAEFRDLASQAKRLSVVARQANHLTRLVNDLLDVARVTSGKVQLRREAVDIDATIRDCIEVLEPRAHERAIGFVVSPTCGAIIEGDGGRLQQVIGNLVTNAIKYSPTGRTITVSSAVVGGKCEVHVRDQGVGIAPEMQPRVFELFAQADGSLDRSEGGMGIGLALVDRLVRLHGGVVRVESRGLGKGSEFIVTLPVGNPPVKLASVPLPVVLHRGLRVVVVDDNPDLLELMQLMLEELGCTVESAEDGEQGLERIIESKPDLALVDIGLPKLDGFAIATQLRERSATPPMLVAITGYGQQHDHQRAIAAGFDAHLTKPIRVETLQSLIQDTRARILGASSRRQQQRD